MHIQTNRVTTHINHMEAKAMRQMTNLDISSRWVTWTKPSNCWFRCRTQASQTRRARDRCLSKRRKAILICQEYPIARDPIESMFIKARKRISMEEIWMHLRQHENTLAKQRGCKDRSIQLSSSWHHKINTNSSCHSSSQSKGSHQHNSRGKCR